MKNVSQIIDLVIDEIEKEFDHTGKHVIRTETIKRRSMAGIDFDGENDDTKYCTQVGFAQVIQSRLYCRGYRSVREGLFVNLDKCTDIPYLVELARSSDDDLDRKQAINARIKSLLKERCDGQSELIFAGSKFIGIKDGITEEQLMERLEADAI